MLSVCYESCLVLFRKSSFTQAFFRTTAINTINTSSYCDVRLDKLVRDIKKALTARIDDQLPLKNDDIGISRQPTRTEMIHELCESGIDFDLTPHNGYLRVHCRKCGRRYAYISPFNTSIICVICHHEDLYQEYKKAFDRVRVHRKPIDKRKFEIIKRFDSQSERYEFDCKRKMNDTDIGLPVDELDSDLYDRISYMNLVTKYEERERQRKYDDMESVRRLRDESENKVDVDDLTANDISGSSPNLAMNETTIRLLWSDSVDFHDVRTVTEQTEFSFLRKQLGVDYVSMETLSRYHVRAHMDTYDRPALLYPRYRGSSSATRFPSGLKVIRKFGDHLEKENYPPMDDNGRLTFSGIFGFHLVSPADRRIVLTTNERDALAVYESTNGLLALALPFGERLDTNLLPYLEDFELIYLWFPHVHDLYAKDYASYLSPNRCFIVNRKERPIELLRNDRKREINKAIRDEAVLLRSKGFRSMTDVRSDLKSEIINSRSKLFGLAQWKRFDVLNKYLIGFRPSEMTVLTGGTGFGKTTFLCEYSLDLLSQGIRTLFCSFEMPDEKILKWMLVQYAALPLYRVEHHPSVEMWLDRFERTKGDLMVMKTDEFRDRTVTQIAAAIKSQVIAAGIQHLVIDNLQFLVGLATMNLDKSNALEKYNQQDRLVGLLRGIATDYGPHVTVVVHPRKTDSDADLDIQHFGGSARVTQEADNVFAIQRRRDEDRKYRKFLYILKNRYGQRKVESDIIEMVFQPSTYTHTLIDLSFSQPGPSR